MGFLRDIRSVFQNFVSDREYASFFQKLLTPFFFLSLSLEVLFPLHSDLCRAKLASMVLGVDGRNKVAFSWDGTFSPGGQLALTKELFTRAAVFRSGLRCDMGYQRQLPESASLSISQDVYLLWDRVSTMMSSQLLHRIVSVYSPKRCSFFSESTLLSPAPSGSVLTAAKLILELIYSNRNGWLLKRRKWLELIVQNKSPPMPSLLTISVPSLFLSVYSNGTCRLA